MSDFAPSDLWFNLVQVCQPPRYFELTDLRGGWCDRYVKPLLAHSTTSSFTCNRLLCILLYSDCDFGVTLSKSQNAFHTFRSAFVDHWCPSSRSQEST